MAKQVKLKVLIPFFDIELGKKRLKNQEFETSQKRAKQLINFEMKIVEILEISSGKK